MNKTLSTDSLSNRFYKWNLLLALIIFGVVILMVQNVNAQLDPTFGTDGITQTDININDIPKATFILPNEKILVVSQNVDTQNITKYHFIRYNSNGTIDTNYGNGGIKEISIPYHPNNVHGAVNNFVIQPDGKILLLTDDIGDGFIIRYNEDGTIDQSFSNNGIHRPNIDFQGNDILVDAKILTDGKILVLGYTLNNSGESRSFFIRYLSNGNLDPTFHDEGFILNAPTPFFTLEKMFMQSDGKVLAFGTSSLLNILVRRFNADGTPDENFSNILIQDDISFENVILLPDDKILLAGTIYKSETLERKSWDVIVKKYNADGTSDNSFGNAGQSLVDVTTTFDDRPFSLGVQADGQILVAANTNVQPNRTQIKGGMFSLIRFSSNGTPNGKFLVTNSHTFARGLINVLPDGKVLSVFQTLQPSDNGDLVLTRTIGVPLETYSFKGVPYDFTNTLYNGTLGISKPSVFRPSEQKWYIHPSVPEFNRNIFGLSDDILVPSDYIGNLGTEMGVFRPSNGTWYVAKDTFNAGQDFIAVQWGQNGDIPTPADFDNDSKSDIAVFRPSNGVWYIRNSNDDSFSFVQWGLNGDKPVVGDYDGDGKTDIAVWRPSDRVWYILRSSDGQPSYIQFGLSEDIPVQEDYDGDGKTDIAVWRPSDRVWYILRSSDGGFYGVQWGLSDDYPVPADYDGDKKTDIAVYRPSQGRWWIFKSSDNSLGVFNWGLSTDRIPQRRQ